MNRPSVWQERLSFGGRVPLTAGLLVVTTFVASCAAAIATRHDVPLFAWAALSPERVYHGEVWRLVTWPFFADSPFDLLFALATYFVFGGDVARELEDRRFVTLFGGLLVTASALTCVVALVAPGLRESAFLGAWPLAASMLIAWALWFPNRVLRLFFVLSLKGARLAWATVALTVLFVVYYGWERNFPALATEGTMLAGLYFPAMRSRAERGRRVRAREREKKERLAKKREAARAHVEVIDRLMREDDDDVEPPPMSPELEAKVQEILRRPKR